MQTYLDCIPCFIRQGLDTARAITDDTRIHERIVREVLLLVADMDPSMPPPWFGRIVYRRLRELTGIEDPYRGAKDRFNHVVMSLLPELRTVVQRDPQPLYAAVKMAIAANVIDLGVVGDIGLDEIRRALREACLVDVHGDLTAFRRKVDNAGEILYLADNAGEIVIDRLLVEALGPERVTVVVRGAPVINDATLKDARMAGLDELVRVVDNGSDAPGTILDDCSAEFRELFDRADLIIAKGQGNFETLSSVDANVVFLMKVKCPVIARHAGLPLGRHVLIPTGEINR